MLVQNKLEEINDKIKNLEDKIDQQNKKLDIILVHDLELWLQFRLYIMKNYMMYLGPY